MPRSSPRLMSREFWILLAAAAIFFLPNGAVTALLPTYVVDELGGTEATAGFVMGSTAVTALLSRLFLGRLGDRRGARLLLVIGALLGAGSFACLVVVPTLTGAYASRLFLGAAGAAVVTGSTMLSVTLAPVERRGQAASLVLIAFHAGAGVGPLLGDALLRRTGYGTVWVCTAAVAALSIAVALLLPFRPGDPHSHPGPLVHPKALLPGVVTLFGVFAFNGLLLFSPLYVREVGMSSVGLVFLTTSITIVTVRLVFGWVPDRVGPVRAGSGALLLTIVATLVLAFWSTPTGLIVGASLTAIGLSMQSPSFLPLAVADVPPTERGSAMATYTGFFDLANTIIGPVMGLVVAYVGYREAFLTSGSAAVVALLILLLVIRPRHRV